MRGQSRFKVSASPDGVLDFWLGGVAALIWPQPAPLSINVGSAVKWHWSTDLCRNLCPRQFERNQRSQAQIHRAISASRSQVLMEFVTISKTACLERSKQLVHFLSDLGTVWQARKTQQPFDFCSSKKLRTRTARA